MSRGKPMDAPRVTPESALSPRDSRSGRFVWSSAPGFPVLDAGDGVEELLGVSPRDLIGQPFEPWIHPEDLQRIEGEVRQWRQQDRALQQFEDRSR